ncbi:hypothetical protein [Colwellia sp. 12G3]|nr:hypothetical protein [Colwellia sp. 12G3]
MNETKTVTKTVAKNIAAIGVSGSAIENDLAEAQAAIAEVE